MSEIMIGTAGWSYEDWRDVVYPPGSTSRFDRLSYVARLCDTVEINSSFYHIPNRRTVQSWISRVSDLPVFKFSAKLYRGLTHDRRDETIDQLLTQYIDTIGQIHKAGRLAAILIQFPWSFKFEENSMRWIDRLVDRLLPMPLAIEVRHVSWLNDRYVAYLKEKQIAFCNIDQPQITGNLPPTTLVTAPFAYVRFHGRNALQWFTENEDSSDRYNYLYSSAEIDFYVDKLREMARQAERVYVYMNNHVGGQGLANACEIQSKLSRKKITVPRQLFEKFPHLQDFAIPRDDNVRWPGVRTNGKDQLPEDLLF